MFQNLIRTAMFTTVQKWLSPEASLTQSLAPFHPNLPQIKTFAIHYASLFTLLVLSLLLFMGGLMITAVATAHSFDTFGYFVATAVFWTGLVMGLTGLVIASIAIFALHKTKVTFNDLLLVEPEVESITLIDRLVRPVFEGVMDGLRAPLHRTARYRGENESYPAA